MYKVEFKVKPELKDENNNYIFTFNLGKVTVNCNRARFRSNSIKEAVESLNLEELEELHIEPVKN